MNRITELLQLRRGKPGQLTLPHLHTINPNFTPPSGSLSKNNLQLDIFVGGRCPICQASLETLQALRRELPNVTVRIIDLDAPNTTRPENVIAIPSILLNGHLVATGNPELADLKKFIWSLS